MKEVDAELYKFMLENECHLYMKNKIVIAWVCVNFYDLEEFVKAVGDWCFDDGGLDVQLLKGYLAIDLNEIIEDEGYLLSSYKDCFSDDEWKLYEKEILEMEK